MSRSAKEVAYKKIDNLVKNVFYDERVENDDYLNNYYKALTIPDSLKFHQIKPLVAKFDGKKEQEKLLKTTVDDRDEFFFSITTVNAWYVAVRNAITIPFGIMQRPLFDTNFPISTLYGAVGTIVGHEIVHGFDSEGVLHDDLGYDSDWLDEESQKGFKQMEKCVIDQYSEYKTQYGKLDGYSKRTENIADNGGKL